MLPNYSQLCANSTLSDNSYRQGGQVRTDVNTSSAFRRHREWVTGCWHV